MKALTIDRVAVVVTFALLFAIATRIPVDTDTWWHLRSGEYTLTQGMIYTDPFSHTFAGQPWINHSWGAQIVLYGTYQLLGNVGLSLYTALLAVGGMAVIYPILRGNAYLKGFLMVIGASAAAVFWSARPQMISFFLSAVTLALLYRYRASPGRSVCGLVLVTILWANMHAGFSIGFIFMGAFLAGETLNRVLIRARALTWRQIGGLVIVVGVCAAALVLTPYGIRTLLVPFQTVSIGALRDYIQEWNSPNFQGRETWPFITMIILAVGAAWAARSRFDWTGFLLFGGTLFMALLYGRNIAVFAVAVLPQLSFWADTALGQHGWVIANRRPTRGQAYLNALLVVIVLLGVGIYVLGGVWDSDEIQTAQETYLPVKLAEYLEQAQPPRALFNSYNWGGYLMFAAPDYPVFIDGRTDLYGEFLRTYLDVTNATGDWRAVLDQYGIRTVAVEKNTGLDTALAQDAQWTRVYSDALAVVYTRGAVP